MDWADINSEPYLQCCFEKAIFQLSEMIQKHDISWNDQSHQSSFSLWNFNICTPPADPNFIFQKFMSYPFFL